MRYVLNQEIRCGILADALNLRIYGDRDQLIKNIGSLNNSGSNTLKFSKDCPEVETYGVLIGPKDSDAESLIVSDNPRLDFSLALSYLIDSGILIELDNIPKIHKSAKIANSAIIKPGTFIGNNSIIEENVVIHSGTKIGSNCIIRSNSVIGAQGFGFVQKQDGTWIRFPHLGGTEICNNVEIGALNSVCVGTLEDTVINDGVKTDNLVHIAHNCSIGKNTILTACTELSGSVYIGKNVWIGPNSSVMQKIRINDDAMVGIGSVVTKDVESGCTVAGVPAKLLKRKI